MKKMIIATSVVILAAGTAAVALAVGLGQGPPPALDTVANQGIAVPAAAFDAQQARFLASGGATTQARSLGARQAVAFYALKAAGGGSCYGAGTAGQSTDVSALDCPSAGTTVHPFPSASAPVLTIATLVTRDESGVTRVAQLGGLAADGVATVAVRAVDGNVYRATVKNNLFLQGVPDAPLAEIVAFDATGKEVWSSADVG